MIKLTVLPGGGLDLALDDASDPSGAAATVVYALLLTDARAPTEREPDAFVAGGWWARPTAGSGLWHVRRQGLGDAARLETLRTIEQALAREPTLANVQVTDVSGSGNISAMLVSIEGQHNGREFLIDLSL